MGLRFGILKWTIENIRDLKFRNLDWKLEIDKTECDGYAETSIGNLNLGGGVSHPLLFYVHYLDVDDAVS